MPSKDYVYKTFGDNQECAATVHYDDSDKSSKAIAIASHGGAFSTGHKDIIPEGQIDWLVKNGFVVVAYNYRLCPNVSFLEGPVGDTIEVYHWSRKTLPGLLRRDVGLEIDADRITAFGQSAGATLIMTLGYESPRPKALLNIYGAAYFTDEWWSKPVPMPWEESDPAIMARVFDEVIQTSTDSKDFDISHPRAAWVCDKLKHGRLLSTLCGHMYEQCDPITMKGGLTKDFPPTYFLHGDQDVLVNVKIAEKTVEGLKKLGVETGIAVMEGGGHGYDFALKDGDKDFEAVVKPGLEFLKSHV
ncbi:alpha/beta-hydrolase [Rhizodiscina lignyota]|uniref:Alpha/beta-hydrolase n=1 Tax=Rhizodiscina lignyota TaxID=1504668 RepID=A0A9P4IL16_9PEZI|nr:alpha/beta-hydrolase [Rhizodiscina lignyota]